MRPQAPPGPVDWEAVCWCLMSAPEGPRLRPWEVRRLTMAEAAAYLDPGDKKGGPRRRAAGGLDLDDAEMEAHFARLRAMTPAELLAWGREAWA